MPYAQVHYPFDAKQSEGFLEHRFPADFIAEGLDQTRGWFYTLMVRERSCMCVCYRRCALLRCPCHTN